MFRLLLNVNGVGPKAALGVLSALSADDLRFAILAGDAKSIGKGSGNWKQNGTENDPGIKG